MKDILDSLLEKYGIEFGNQKLTEPIFSDKMIFFILDGAKTTGSYREGIQFYEENMTSEQRNNALSFVEWMEKNNLTADHGNIQERIDQWLDEVPGKDE